VLRDRAGQIRRVLENSGGRVKYEAARWLGRGASDRHVGWRPDARYGEAPKMTATAIKEILLPAIVGAKRHEIEQVHAA